MSTLPTIRPLREQGLGFGYGLRVLASEVKYEFLGRLRLRAYSLSVIGFPVVFYVIFALMHKDSGAGTYLLASYSCFGAVGACLFGLGVSVSQERMQGWLDLKLASPMPRWTYLGAKLASCALFAVIIVTILLALGIGAAGVHLRAVQVLCLYGVVLAGVIPFCAMGIMLAMLVKPNAAPGTINLIYLPMSALSGLWMPLSTLPHWLKEIAPIWPTYHYGQLALGVFGYAQPGSSWVHWNWLIAFSCLMLGGAWWIFARSESKA